MYGSGSLPGPNGPEHVTWHSDIELLGRAPVMLSEADVLTIHRPNGEPERYIVTRVEDDPDSPGAYVVTMLADPAEESEHCRPR